MCQMLWQYSRIGRSEENLPMEIGVQMGFSRKFDD